MAGIFDRPGNLRPSQFTLVAQRRFGDAMALCATNDNERANGALYLCGFVVEILLKAQLLRKYQHLGRQRSSEVADAERTIWNLIWRSHDQNELLGHLPHVVVAVKAAGERRGKPLEQYLKQTCATWTIHVRYSPASTTVAEARVMLERVRDLKEILK